MLSWWHNAARWVPLLFGEPFRDRLSEYGSCYLIYYLRINVCTLRLVVRMCYRRVYGRIGGERTQQCGTANGRGRVEASAPFVPFPFLISYFPGSKV
jgi:hypothetical protein